jgi:drug/metabolite transporter (DMT)-like permease
MDPGLFVMLRDASTAGIVVLAARRATGSWVALLPRPEDRLGFATLGVFGVYFGRYLFVLGLKFGSPVLAATWQNMIPPVTYLFGVVLGTERLNCEPATVLRLGGVVAAVGGAVAATRGQGDDGDATDAALASVFFALQVAVGGAGFWHLQKSLLLKGYAPIQVVAWYYTTGVTTVALAALPHATDPELWRFSRADRAALGGGLLLWPLLAYLLAFGNQHASPVAVMAFAPLQIVATMVIDFVCHGMVPGTAVAAGAGAVTVGLTLFVAGSLLQRRAQSDLGEGPGGTERAADVEHESKCEVVALSDLEVI